MSARNNKKRRRNHQSRQHANPVAAAGPTDPVLIQQMFVALQAGHHGEVEADVEQRLQVSPHDLALLRILGLTRMLQQRMENAIAPLRSAAELDPSHAETLSRLGYALDATGRFSEAAPAHRSAITFAPDHIPFRLNAIANALHLQEYQEADRLTRAGLERAPQSSELQAALRKVETEAGRVPESCAKLEEAVAHNPGNANLVDHLAHACLRLGKPDRAIHHLRALIPAGTLGGKHLNLLIKLLLRERRIADAEAVISQVGATTLKEDARYSHNCGLVLEQQGNIDAARSAYCEAIGRAPERVGPLRSWLLISQARLDDPNVRRLQSQYRKCRHTGTEIRQADLGFLLAKVYWDDGDPMRAIRFYDEANQLLALYFSRKNQGMEQGPCAAMGGHLIRQSVKSLREAAIVCNPDERPIFILGMPRSGKTLVESMLGRHPMVTRTDEDRSFTVACQWLLRDWRYEAHDPERILARLRESTVDEVGSLQRWYLERISRFDEHSPRLTQTNPFYLPYVGIIHALFPRARFIFCSRDPEDLGLACYGKDFNSPGMMYACDLYRLGQEIRSSELLTDHWQNILPADQVTTVRYEDFVAHPEEEVKRLYHHLGLSPADADPATPAAESATTTGTFALTGSEPGAPHNRFVGIAASVNKQLQQLRDGYEQGPDWLTQ